MKIIKTLIVAATLPLSILRGQTNKPILLPPLDTSRQRIFSNIDYEKIYFDAGGGYFPESGNNAWAGQLSGGYRFNSKSALGIGATYWGRTGIYERRAWGLGVQYRRTFWAFLNLKIEVGYVVKATMYDNNLDRKMTYFAASSSPIYYKFDAHWRVRHYLTLGISACQTRDLSFNRYVSDLISTTDVWRINALTVQLGIALDTFNSAND